MGEERGMPRLKLFEARLILVPPLSFLLGGRARSTRSFPN